MTPASPAALARRPAASSCPGVGNFEATSALDAAWRRAIAGVVDLGAALTARDLPRPAVAVRRQRGSAPDAAARRLRLRDGQSGRCRLIGACRPITDRLAARPRPPTKGAPLQGTARRLEQPAPDAGRPGCSTAWRLEGRSGVFHPLVRGAGDRRLRRRDDSYGVRVREPSSSGTGWSACSFTRRSRATSACASPERPQSDGGIATNAARIDSAHAVESGSSPASTSATARSSRASTSKGCGTPAIPRRSARRYNREGIDEVVILDVTATIEKRKALARTIHAVAQEIFLPLCVGGGIRDEAHADGGHRGGRRQGQPEHRGASRSRSC